MIVPHRTLCRDPRRLLPALGLLLAASCSGGTRSAAPAPSPAAPAALPVAPALPAEKSEKPPPPGVAPDWKFPRFTEQTLDNGLALRIVPRRALPLLRVELVVKSGSATDGDKPGLAAVAGELLKAGGAGKWTGRALLDAAESLGSSLDVTTDRDSTRISLSVMREHLAAALGILSAVVATPRLDPAEFRKLKARERDRVASLTRTSASWAASMVLYRELFDLPVGVHPYSRYDATPKDIDALSREDCKKWHAREVTPENSVLVIAGDVEDARATEEARRAFSGFAGKKPDAPTFAPPRGPKTLTIHLVDRPGSAQAEVFLATLGPERKNPTWPALRATNQVLGGGVAGRLFLDVREKRSLAYSTRSSLQGVAVGPSPVVLSAGTQTAKAGLAVEALLHHFEQLGKAPPSDDEMAIATQYLSDVFLVGVDTVTAISSMTADLAVLGLPGDYYDSYRTEVRGVTPAQAFAAASPLFVRERAVVVVAGDAARLGKPLSRFAPVQIIDPENAFVTRSTLPHDPSAKAELERIQGT